MGNETSRVFAGSGDISGELEDEEQRGKGDDENEQIDLEGDHQDSISKMSQGEVGDGDKTIVDAEKQEGAAVVEKTEDDKIGGSPPEKQNVGKN